MRVATYGEHAENAARWLNRLITLDDLPTDPAAIDQLLHCREALVDALRQRLYAFGVEAGATLHQGVEPTALLRGVEPTALRLLGLDQRLATVLDHIAFAVPSLPLEERMAPVDVLGEASLDPVVETWRNAAIDMLAASHALDTAEDKPWLHDPGAGWYLMGDTAVALEAVLVLDARLAEVGLLAEHHTPDYPLGLDEKRLVASQTARLATWHATSDSPDHAAPRRPRDTSNVLHPVSLVAVPEDLAGAQQRLATYLQPMSGNDVFFEGAPEMSADSARQLTASQLFLCRTFAQMASRSPTTAELAEFFTARAEVLACLQPQLSYLVDVEHEEPNRRRFWQQSELTTAVTRMQGQGGDLGLQPLQMLALANATHEVTHRLGVCLRRELRRTNSNLVDANPCYVGRPTRVARRSRLGATTTDLVNMPAPSSPTAAYASPLQRAALRQTLDVTPSSSRPPAPYPVARSLAAYDAPPL